MDKFAGLTGRQYSLFEYSGADDAEKIIVIMGSAAETVKQTVARLAPQAEKIGVIHVRLYLPFAQQAFLNALPSTVKSIAVLDRTKSPGATGEPLFHDVVATLSEAFNAEKLTRLPKTIGGRYGLFKEFTPAMVKGIFDELGKAQPKNHFTIGIVDDVSHHSLDYDPAFSIDPERQISALFFGLGADGTVGANKNTINIIGESPDFYAQGYLSYDSKKSGSQTVSHLRFGPEPIRAPYLVQTAQFIGCHQFNFLFKTDILAQAAPGSVFLLNSPYAIEEIWDHLPRTIQETIIGKRLSFHVIDASKVALETGMGNRVNTILQTCFFALSGVLPREQAIAKIKETIKKTYSKKGEDIVQQNFAAVDQTLAHLYQVKVPERVTSSLEMPPIVPLQAPRFVQEVTAKMMAGAGDQLSVSQLPLDGTYPSGTTAWEKRNVSDSVPEWEPDLCIQCGNCSFVCPHAVIRAKFYNQNLLESAPEGFKSAGISARGFPEIRYTLQIYLEDCTGCNLCVSVCPAISLKQSGVKAINMKPKAPLMAQEQANIRFFETLPHNDRARVDFSSIRGAQFLQPLFEFSGACAGCGETPYVKLVSQLFGDRLIVANATGCSSIYGGNLPTTPWTKNPEGRGPAWSNSLFEDNAEFGFGFRLTADKHRALAIQLLREFQPELGSDFVNQVINAPQKTESQIRKQRERVAELKAVLLQNNSDLAQDLLSVIDHLVRRSIWIIGGDGWAYDIGSGGLDHILASGRDVNVLVLDTEVYSNTGGQMSKSTPLGAVAKFAAAGKTVAKKISPCKPFPTVMSMSPASPWVRIRSKRC